MVLVIYESRWETASLSAMLQENQYLCRKHGFSLQAALATLHQAQLYTYEGRLEEGIQLMRRALETLQVTGDLLQFPYHLGLLAEAHGKGGQVEEGLNVLAEALAQVERTGERLHEAELYRLKGELLLQSQVESHKSKVEGAEACFFKAIEIARHQQAKSWELRASTSLARLWQQQGKRTEARHMLAEIYGWFTEGFDTKDLQEARALIDELNH